MKTRYLGTGGPVVSVIGLGCMSFAGTFGATEDATSLRCLDAAYEAGINFLDTANIYGMGRSETVIGEWLATRRPQNIVLASKCAIQRDPERPVNNDPAHLRQELEGSLKRLGVEYIDLYYLHRREPSVPLEDVIGTMADLVQEGKIGGYGLSEVAPYTVRRAHEIHPCWAVQNEYSLWTRLPELGLIQTCRELGISFVPFSPLARGVFGETYPDAAAMEAGDFRLMIPRFEGDNYIRNQAMIDPFKDYARARGLSVASLALAWVLHQGEHLLPIPGTRTAEHLREWVHADDIVLSAQDLAEIEAILPVGFAYGDRYNDVLTRAPERYC